MTHVICSMILIYSTNGTVIFSEADVRGRVVKTMEQTFLVDVSEAHKSRNVINDMTELKELDKNKCKKAW